MGDHPIQGLGDIQTAGAASVRKDLERDDVHARRHAGVGAVLRADDAGDVRAVAGVVRRVGVVGAGKIVGKDDAIRHAIVVGVRPEEAVVEIDAGIDHHHRYAVPVDPGEARIRTKQIRLDQDGIGLRGDRLCCDGKGRRRRLARCGAVGWGAVNRCVVLGYRRRLDASRHDRKSYIVGDAPDHSRGPPGRHVRTRHYSSVALTLTLPCPFRCAAVCATLSP